MANLNNFVAFSLASESWETYVECFECFLEANDLTNFPSSRKQAQFLNACGHKMFGTATALVASQPIQSLPWETLLERLQNHYAPAPSRIVRRHAFQQRLQKEGEYVNHYMAALRSAALHCDFPNLDDSLLEQLVCGVRVRHQLLAR